MEEWRGDFFTFSSWKILRQKPSFLWNLSWFIFLHRRTHALMDDLFFPYKKWRKPLFFSKIQNFPLFEKWLSVLYGRTMFPKRVKISEVAAVSLTARSPPPPPQTEIETLQGSSCSFPTYQDRKKDRLLNFRFEIQPTFGYMCDVGCFGNWKKGQYSHLPLLYSTYISMALSFRCGLRGRKGRRGKTILAPYLIAKVEEFDDIIKSLFSGNFRTFRRKI